MDMKIEPTDDSLELNDTSKIYIEIAQFGESIRGSIIEQEAHADSEKKSETLEQHDGGEGEGQGQEGQKNEETPNVIKKDNSDIETVEK